MKALRRTLEPRLRRWWSEPGAAGSLLSAVTLPLEVAYRAAVGFRNTAYDLGVLRASRGVLPVVSVGNLSVGGTGKTPVSAWMAARLQAFGAHPAILLRGYGDDEVLLHRRWNPSIPVLPDPDRLRACRAAAQAGADVVVLDDGFQHRRLARDLDVVLIAAEQPLPGRLLPRGPFREGAAALRRADLVVVTRRVAGDTEVQACVTRLELLAPSKPVAVLRLEPAGWTDLSGEASEAPAGDVLAVTSVADPGSFHALITRNVRGQVERMSYPDHHRFDASDAREIARAARGRAVAVTEKDAVKLVALSGLLPPLVHVLTLVVRPDAGAERIDSLLAQIARKVRARPDGSLEPGRTTLRAGSRVALTSISGARA